jgi:hypothetical protein
MLVARQFHPLGIFAVQAVVTTVCPETQGGVGGPEDDVADVFTVEEALVVVAGPDVVRVGVDADAVPRLPVATGSAG